MKLKCTVNLNRIPENYKVLEDFTKAREYHLKHGVEWEFTFKNVDVHGYTTYHLLQPLDRWLIQGSWNLIPQSSSDVEMFVFDQSEWATPESSPFPLKPNTPNGSCLPFNGKPFVNVGAYIDDHNNGQLAIQIQHELMHALTEIANTKGYPTLDQMDTYDQNANPDSLTGNFAKQWALLQPYIAPETPTSPPQPSVTIKRNISDSKETTGVLTAFNNGASFSCKTLELPYKGNMSNVSSIPEGVYKVIWSFSPRLLKFTYEVIAPPRSGIRFHSANYFYDLKGCIALGSNLVDLNGDGEMDTASSRLTIKAFENFMQRKTFTLTIKKQSGG